MAASALTALIPSLTGRRVERGACGLTFDRPGGPLVAVCALVGGSGASTLAFCLARQAARESKTPVLLTEADARGAGLAVLAGQTTEVCLPGLARQVAERQAPERSFAELEPRLRLLSSAPRRATESDPEHLRALLRDARAAHGLVIVDCGTDWAAAAPVLNEATHIVWALPATPAAVARAQLLFASGVLPQPGRWRELLAATAVYARSSARVRALRHLAADRCERLILIPHSEALARGDIAHGAEHLSRGLTGLAPTLRRGR
jgi:hypothetical protein